MSTDVDVFRFGGKRYAVSFAEINITNYDPGYRNLQIGLKVERDEDNHIVKTAMFKKSYRHPATRGLGKTIATGRKAILCVVRSAYTGEPFSGVAILSPTDKDRSYNAKMSARRLSAKRAIIAIANSLWADWVVSKRGNINAFVTRKKLAAMMWSEYRKMLREKYVGANALLQPSAINKLNGSSPVQKLPVDPVYSGNTVLEGQL